MSITSRSQPSRVKSRFVMRIGRFFGVLLLVVVILTAITLIAGAIVKNNLKARYSAPGQLIDVGGYKMHISCQGQGSPTVVMESGLGEYSLTWALVNPDVARSTRACVYDRAGYGWSERSPGSHTAQEIADELHTLLTRGGIQGPYVLVGHSMGGVYVRLYAHQYPGEVVGMVLVDSSHEEMISRLPEELQLQAKQINMQAIEELRFPKLLNALGVMALFPGIIPGDPRLPLSTQEVYRGLLASDGKFFATLTEEIVASDESLAQVRAARITSLGNIPLIVLKAGKLPEPEPSTEVPVEGGQQFDLEEYNLQAELAALSPNSKLVVAEQSGHYIHLDEPELVIDAIQQVVEAAQE